MSSTPRRRRSCETRSASSWNSTPTIRSTANTGPRCPQVPTTLGVRDLGKLAVGDGLLRSFPSFPAVADHELEAKRRVEAEEQARIRGTAVEAPRGDALAPGVEEDVQEMLQGKNFAELQVRSCRGGCLPSRRGGATAVFGTIGTAVQSKQLSLNTETFVWPLSQGLRAEVQGMLQSGEADDPEYWGAVLHRLTVHVARARVREIHADILDRHIARTGAGADTVVDLGALRREKRRGRRWATHAHCSINSGGLAAWLNGRVGPSLAFDTAAAWVIGCG